MTIHFDHRGPRDVFNQVIAHYTRHALAEGAAKYGDAWKDYLRTDAFEAARHTIEYHVHPALGVALQDLDYGRVSGFIHNIARAVGYLSVALLKVYWWNQHKEQPHEHTE